MMFLELLLTVCFAMMNRNANEQVLVERHIMPLNTMKNVLPPPQENNLCGEKNDDTKTDWQYENRAREEQPIKSMEKGSDREKEPSKICSGHALLQTEMSPQLYALWETEVVRFMKKGPFREQRFSMLYGPALLKSEMSHQFCMTDDKRAAMRDKKGAAKIMEEGSFRERSKEEIPYPRYPEGEPSEDRVAEKWPGHERLKEKISYPRCAEGEQREARIMDNRSFCEQSLSNIFYGHALLKKEMSPQLCMTDEQREARIMDNRSFCEQSLSNIFYGHALLKREMSPQLCMTDEQRAAMIRDDGSF